LHRGAESSEATIDATTPRGTWPPVAPMYLGLSSCSASRSSVSHPGAIRGMVAEEQLRQRAVRNRAVMMDGANLMQIMRKVTLPLGRLRSPISLAVASRTMV